MLGYEGHPAATMDDMTPLSRRSVVCAPTSSRWRYALHELPAQRRIGYPQAGRFMARPVRFDQAGRGPAWRWLTASRASQCRLSLMGHLGLTPQSASALGGYKVQGRAARSQRRSSTRQSTGTGWRFAVLLKWSPTRSARSSPSGPENCIIMSPRLRSACPRAALIYHDMFGLYPRFKTRMARCLATPGRSS